MIENNSIITLSDNKEYVVVKKYDENNTTYVYLVDINDNSNFIFGKQINDEIVKITDIDELYNMFKHLNLDFMGLN